MRIVVIGCGVQGRKRHAVAGDDVIAVVDPFNDEADYKKIQDVSSKQYDAALVCTPDDVKLELLSYLLDAGKSVLVEKPLLANDSNDILKLAKLAKKNNVVCYTAYNHRFEPHFVNMKRLIDSGELGKIYSIRMFYGNGTARLVRESAWRDQDAGVLPDLGSHLLDTILFWFGEPSSTFSIHAARKFENKAFDHISLASNGDPLIQLEMTLLSWRNHFYADLFAENGSVHIRSLCKWGPSEFVVRTRKLPSGRPDEKIETLAQADPTWDLEYAYFKKLCAAPADHGFGNLQNDIWINDQLQNLTTQAFAGAS